MILLRLDLLLRHKLLLLTKSAKPDCLLQNSYQECIVYSISANPESIARGYEHNAPSCLERIDPCKQVKEAGYEVRVRVDPIIAGSGPAYTILMERICTFIEPSLITLGTLRSTPRTYHFLPKTIRALLTERVEWGYGYSFEKRLSIYDELVAIAKRYGIPVALCKEPIKAWRRLGLKGRCNCML
ncbi:MAG: hypothetical protein ACUVTD_04755 [Nitrososphaerales archaeon]